MTVTKAQYEELAAKPASEQTDDDRRLIKQYERGDYDKGGATSPGTSSSTSDDEPPQNEKSTKQDPLSSARTTANPSSKGQTVDSAAPSTGGSGKTSQSPGSKTSK